MRSRVLVSLLLLTAGCSQRKFGEGIGRPDAPVIDRPDLLPLRITEVFAGASSFVELLASADTTLDGLSLCTERGLCVPLTGTWTAGQRKAVDAATLLLVPTYGEVAVVDPVSAEGGVPQVAHAYLAWGGAPRADSMVTAAALTSGVIGPEEFVALPYPMPANVAVISDGGSEGCAASSENNPSVVDPTLCPIGSPVLRLTEVLATPTPPTPSWIELRNLASVALPLYGVRVCQPPTCAAFGPNASLAPGEVAQVFVGGPDTNPGDLDLPDAAPLAPAGEVAVLAPGSSDIADARAMQSFLRYGDLAPDLAFAADVACLWPSPDETVAPAPSGESLSSPADAPVGATAWTAGTPTADSDSSSAPPADAATSPLVIEVVDRHDQIVVLRNVGTTPLTLAAYELDLGAPGAAFALPLDQVALASLDARLDLTIGLGGSCTLDAETGDDDHDACWPDATVRLEASGEASLFLGATLVHYVRWGTGVATNAQGAADLGIWAAPWCSAPALDADGALALAPGASGHRPAHYL